MHFSGWSTHSVHWSLEWRPWPPKVVNHCLRSLLPCRCWVPCGPSVLVVSLKLLLLLWLVLVLPGLDKLHWVAVTETLQSLESASIPYSKYWHTDNFAHFRYCSFENEESFSFSWTIFSPCAAITKRELRLFLCIWRVDPDLWDFKFIQFWALL